jgi:hypothetical protein
MPVEGAANENGTRQHMLDLPKPGQLLHLDFRQPATSPEDGARHAAEAAISSTSGTIRLVQVHLPSLMSDGRRFTK